MKVDEIGQSIDLLKYVDMKEVQHLILDGFTSLDCVDFNALKLSIDKIDSHLDTFKVRFTPELQCDALKDVFRHGKYQLCITSSETELKESEFEIDFGENEFECQNMEWKNCKDYTQLNASLKFVLKDRIYSTCKIGLMSSTVV